MSSSSLSWWSRVQALAWVPALVWCACASGEPRREAVAIGIGASVVWLAVVLRAPRTVADVVTLIRALAAAALLVAPTWLGDRPWWTWSLLVAVAALDLVDGALARRFGATSGGAVLDMETDQLTVLT
ncbi:MAG: CDP-alcohol phosphatidyltransferase family protein, partial [Planctomycetes bacterium]|nr:CDP-alcohol phosphatidyltransferase family protein [Planctomycetota bacterium]